ncbi:capsule assembly Wzi family protein [Fervidobacterium thailandense]|uniref:Capsule assembly Wzi family protein n=1 Tax=Fervidobacterium thailandense TaxID=1008305 RepID=A0A1E3G428_9BACT|nr:capsule assembly Wzi family protein [Fervidobacterium thailandense]ODN30987.1 hypothetical protein A4H02_01540 [Fervidobacterium thailandense]
MERLRSWAFVLILFAFSNTGFSTLVYSAEYFGARPVPRIWENPTCESSSSASARINFSLNISKWPSDLVRKYSYAWGTPTNPAEGVFYLQEELPKLLELDLSLGNDSFCFFVNLSLQKEYQNKLRTLETLHNVPLDLSIDLNFPSEAYLYYASDNFFIAVGRFKISWGNARYPVSVAPVSPFDNITFMIRFSDFVFTFHAIPSYQLLTPPEYEIQRSYSDQHMAGQYFFEPSKYIFAHRLDFHRNFSNDFALRVGIGEINVVGGKYPDLIDLSPAVFYHNTYGEGYSNVAGGIDFSLWYRNSVNFYGEFFMDDFVSPTEVGSSYKPGAYAYNVGINLKSENHNLWLEYAYVSEWMYVTNYLPYLRINVRKFYIQNFPPTRFLVDYPLGFIYGPDAKMFSLGFESCLGEVGYSLEYNYLIKGLVKDGETIRWKWFWDSWPGNVSEPGATTPERAGEQGYHLLTARANFKNFTLLYKTVNLENHYLGLTVSLKW